MKKKVFIIGNGFDLNLGWKTSYRDFAHSDYCPIHPAGNGSCPMEEYLARKIEVERWYDLEKNREESGGQELSYGRNMMLK